MANFNLSHTGQDIDDALQQAINGDVSFATVAALITHLQGLSSLPATGSTFSTNGRTTAEDRL